MRSFINTKSGKRFLFPALLVIATSTLLLTYCGGGGGGGYGGSGGTAIYYNISGTVTSGGTGLAGVTMTLSGAGSGTTTTDASGNYTFGTLVNGSYAITPGLTGFTFAPASSPQTVSGANITSVDFTATAVALPTVQLVACPGSGTTDATIQDFSFSPATIPISANTIVKWTNNGPSTHTVTSTTVPANGSFDSSNIASGTSVCFKFTTAGTYHYHCSIHTIMTGTVTVQ